jgi:CO/xanthine dehydrogenase Mo-binding subunit
MTFRINAPGICGGGALVANAIFDATGLQLRDLPMSPEVMQKAQKEARLTSP